MIDTIIDIVKIIIAILPLIILCFAGKRVNLPKPDRSKQFFMPIITLVYVIAMMALITPLNDWLKDFIGDLPDMILAFGNQQSWMPEQGKSILDQLCNAVKTFLQSLNLDLWIFFISNTLIMTVYLILKRISIQIMKKAVKTDSELHSKIAGNFYEYFSEKGMWCLKESYVQVRGMFRLFYNTAVILSAILMLASRWFYLNELIKTVYYPVFGILIVGELYFYLDGATKREYTQDILGEDEDAYKIVNYSLLRKFLRSVFGDKLLSENTSINNALAYDVTTDEIIKKLESSDDQKIVSFAAYVDMLNKTGFRIDHSYLHSSLDMLNGKSILFNNPFYNDLIPYAFYPMNRVLLSHQKVLVVLGRHSVEEDIKEWIEKGIASVTNIPFLWNIGILNSEHQDLDIGIVTRSDVLNIELQNANSAFLEEVGFVVIIEPSKLISTAQIGLNLLTKKCRTDENKNIVFCLCDKNCDGLVDAMSHILMTSITEVSATKKHLGTSSYMCWDADEEYLHHRLTPNISRYLGMGTELSFAALKNQVSKTKWFGGEAFPVTDIRWIDRQYYYDLTKYASLSTTQEAMEDHFLTSPNFWSAEVEKNSYITVEDEAFNMFEILRDFSTRTTDQGFINIISSDYLLKDYMADNASIFETDAKAIPYIVADYTRSNRNTILRLILMMSTFPVGEEALKKELSLLGIEVFDLKKQLWYELFNCYSKVSQTCELPEDYKEAVNAVYSKTLELGDARWDHDLINFKDSFNFKSAKMETVYFISDPAFLSMCVSELRSAGYVSEDEKGQKYYLGSELSGHIYQKYLPGQFFTFGGKYYEMQYLTADGQVLIRRAADHINGRPTYRQIRNYTICGAKSSENIGSHKNIAGMKLIKEFVDISVSTPGYYLMKRYNDFASAKCILFEGEKSGIPERVYHNKEILRIELPDFGGKLNDNIRYTVTVLLNEIFKTLFAENQAYICAVTDDSFLDEFNGTKPFTYSVKGENYELKSNAIYIIEDSQLDLGLTVAVERNLQRIFSIIHDYIDWHYETLEASLNPPHDPKPPIVFTDPQDPEEPKEKGAKGKISAIKDKIKNAFSKLKDKFKKKPKKGDAPTEEEDPTDKDIPENEEDPTDKNIPENEEDPTEDEIPENDEDEIVTEIPADEKETVESEDLTADVTESEEIESNETASENEAIQTDTVNTDDAPLGIGSISQSESEKAEKTGFSVEREPYHNRYYLLYGQECENSFIDLKGVLDYLSEMGLQNNSLKQARDGKKTADLVAATFKPGKPESRYCDFCGCEILGVEYETLADGRDRCMNCGKTAIKTGEEFRKIFEDVKRNMESFFGIRINAGIRVEMVNSRTLHRRLGKAYIPTPKSDGRVLGVAIKDKNGYTLMVENGSPRMASMLTMAHELTHIWQYINWNDRAIRRKYGKNLRLEIYEGMAKWVEIQYAYLINEPVIAKREEIITSYRDDEYGRGFLRYRANYPFSLGTVITKMTPFMNLDTPLDPEFCGSFRVILPTDGIVDPVDDEDKDKTKDPIDEIPSFTGAIDGPIERDPNSLNRYAYGLLNDGEKAVYASILEAINNYCEELIGLEAELTSDQVFRIVDYMQQDHPELFWFRRGALCYSDPETNTVNKIAFTYCMTQEEAQKRQELIDLAIKPFLSGIKDSMSDYEVTLHLYENIIDLVDYDTVGLDKQKKIGHISSDKPDDLRSIYGVFVNKKAVCAGYAMAMQYLLNLCGIECTYIRSEPDPEDGTTHAWNLIKLEGDYYHLDATWGDHSNTSREKDNPDASNYNYFCITTAEVVKLRYHIPEKDLPIPECTATKCNYHRRHGLYFEKYDYEKVKSIVCESFKCNRLDISFKFSSSEVYNEAKQNLISERKFREAIQFANMKVNAKVSPSYRYYTYDDDFIVSFYLTKP